MPIQTGAVLIRMGLAAIQMGALPSRWEPHLSWMGVFPGLLGTFLFGMATFPIEMRTARRRIGDVAIWIAPLPHLDGRVRFLKGAFAIQMGGASIWMGHSPMQPGEGPLRIGIVAILVGGFPERFQGARRRLQTDGSELRTARSGFRAVGSSLPSCWSSFRPGRISRGYGAARLLLARFRRGPGASRAALAARSDLSETGKLAASPPDDFPAAPAGSEPF